MVLVHWRQPPYVEGVEYKDMVRDPPVEISRVQDVDLSEEIRVTRKEKEDDG